MCEPYSDLQMQTAAAAMGNSRTEPTRERAVLRALRHLFLWGWARYKGQLVQQEAHLTAFFFFSAKTSGCAASGDEGAAHRDGQCPRLAQREAARASWLSERQHVV